MKLAVFDLDHTLMPVDTGDWWGKWLLQACDEQTRRQGEQTLGRFAREYIEQTLSIEEFETWQMGFLAQFDRGELEVVREDYKREVLAKIIPGTACSVVERAAKEGCVTAICTATYSFATEPSAELFGVDHLLAVRPEEDAQGRFTGRWLEPITYQEGKVTAVKELVEKLECGGASIDAYEFWSDSAADLPLFEYIASMGGECFVVNARENLQRIARERSWHVGRTFTGEEEQKALAIIAKAMANRENSPRLSKIHA